MTALGATTEAHTPTPWCLGNHGTLMRRDAIGNPERHIAESVWPAGEPQGIADMQFIVLACNSFDALTEANKKLREALAELLAAELSQMPPAEDGIEAQNAWAARRAAARNSAAMLLKVQS